MLSIGFIRENRSLVEKAIVDKYIDLNLDDLLAKDAARRLLEREIDGLRQERNKRSERKPTADMIERGKELKTQIANLENALAESQKDLSNLMAKVPNITSWDTPVGRDDTSNLEIFRSEVVPEFDFVPKDHMQIAKDLDIIDFDKGTKVSGYRGYYIKNEGVSLLLGFMMYAMHKMIAKGFSPMLVPTIVKGFTLFGSGYFRGTEYDPEVDEVYQLVTSDKEANGRISKEKKFLVGTAEPSLLAYYANEVIDESQLPLRLSGFSPCYRSEVGSYGKDTKGMYRVHEFMKVEQVIIARANIDESVALQDEMVAISKEMHEDLGIPYRQLQICTGDMGAGKYRMLDIEAWLPGMNRWGETGSASNFLDWQARRLNIRYRSGGGKKEHVFMLNNTALPSPRIFIAILENHQREDGSVVIPAAIKPFMPAKFDVIKKK